MLAAKKVLPVLMGSIIAATSALLPVSSHAALYNFTSHTFTACGATGSTGPTYASCNTAYGTTWSANTNQFNVVSGIQSWTVPQSGSYRLLALGASGGTGRAGAGLGASMRGDFNLVEGQVLKIVVGQLGTFTGTASGGGGGTFVWKSTDTTTPLVIAGGGGGGGYGTGDQHGKTGTTGGTGGDGDGWSPSNPGTGGSNGAGGLCGTGGNSGCNTGGGGGWNSDGQEPGGGKGLANLFLGGATYGGFGGGAAGFNQGGNSAAGGGGGYSGGGGGGYGSSGSYYGGAGGGGGSYNSGTSQVNTAGANTGAGSFQITLVTPLSVTTTTSMSFPSGVNGIKYRTRTSIQVNVSSDGPVTFTANGRRIAGCISIRSTSGVATCYWTPSTRGIVAISAQVKPTNTSYLTATTGMTRIEVGRRTANR